MSFQLAGRSFTSESVTAGHPDKVADQISDAILDSILTEDANARVACETLVTTGLVLVTGEISTDVTVNFSEIIRSTVRQIGYTRAKYGFDAETCAVLSAIDEQSPDIAQGVNRGQQEGIDPGHLGAGDQGIMYGYACRETSELMPLPIDLAHRLVRRLSHCRKSDIMPYLRPDGKAQCTVGYDEDGKPERVETVVVSAQHRSDVDLETIRSDVRENIIEPVIPGALLDDETEYFINPTGRFVLGGPQADAGVTGRKIIVDTYGGRAHHGGGCFSGKDPTKVDRSASYAARWAAKNVIAAGLADECELELAYAIGVSEPVSIRVDTFGTGRIPDKTIEELILEYFDFKPGAIIRQLKLRRPIYEPTAAYGHFGRSNVQFSWENTDRAVQLREGAGLGGLSVEPEWQLPDLQGRDQNK